MGQIVDKFIGELGLQLAERKVKIELSDTARAYLAKKGYDPLNGARPLGRVIQDEIKRPLTDEMLFGKLASGGSVRVDVAGEGGDKVTFEFGADKALPAIS
jgi:ATP-dependent Clp protease ATP-binding subunit ClpA